jgi:hypothetical protein
VKWNVFNTRLGLRPWRAIVEGVLVRDAAKRQLSFTTRRAAEIGAQRAMLKRALRSLSTCLYWAARAAVAFAAIPPGLRSRLNESPLSPAAALHAAALPGGSAPDVLVALDACEERGVFRAVAILCLDAMWLAAQRKVRMRTS